MPRARCSSYELAVKLLGCSVFASLFRYDDMWARSWGDCRPFIRALVGLGTY